MIYTVRPVYTIISLKEQQLSLPYISYILDMTTQQGAYYEDNTIIIIAEHNGYRKEKDIIYKGKKIGLTISK